MHHGRRRHHRGLGLRWYDRENVLERLESYQRDLEQELADVSDLITRLRAGEVGTASAPKRNLTREAKAGVSSPPRAPSSHATRTALPSRA